MMYQVIICDDSLIHKLEVTFWDNAAIRFELRRAKNFDRILIRGATLAKEDSRHNWGNLRHVMHVGGLNGGDFETQKNKMVV